MKNEVNWGMFQDPMLTIIALILMATLWIIIPDPKTEELGSMNAAEMEKKVSMQKERMLDLQHQIDQLIQEIKILQRMKASMPTATTQNEPGVKEEIELLLSQLASLKASLKQKKLSLDNLKKELAELRKKLPDKKKIDELEQQIRNYQQQVENSESLLFQLDEKLEKSQLQQQEALSSQTQQTELAEKLSREIMAQDAIITRLDSIYGSLEKILAKSRGLARYASPAGKGQIAFECVNNSILLMDETNYKTETFLGTYNGSTRVYGRTKRLPGAKGESITTISNPMRSFIQKLKSESPQEKYLYFFVHGNSYGIFLKAREIAWEHGYTVGWAPNEADEFYRGVDTSGNQKVR